MGSSACFQQWMQRVQSEVRAGDAGEHVDDEHSSKEAVTCNKLKTLDAVICTGSRWRGIAVEDAVIEYMTKYATKSGQGSLIKVGRMRERISKAYVLAGGENVAPVSDSALDKEDPAGTSETQPIIQEWSLRTSKNY